jgi:hypothetical protein
MHFYPFIFYNSAILTLYLKWAIFAPQLRPLSDLPPLNYILIQFR